MQLTVLLSLNLLLYGEKSLSFKDNEKENELVQSPILETKRS
jgi:hypothetical protein